jgi:hypothetical protein
VRHDAERPPPRELRRERGGEAGSARGLGRRAERAHDAVRGQRARDRARGEHGHAVDTAREGRDLRDRRRERRVRGVDFLRDEDE